MLDILFQLQNSTYFDQIIAGYYFYLSKYEKGVYGEFKYIYHDIRYVNPKVKYENTE